MLPNPEPIGLPAPDWLLQSLLVLTFALHITAMALMVGGTLFALGFELWGRIRGHSPRAGGPRVGGVTEAGGIPLAGGPAVARQLWRLLPTLTAFTITLGVAPLLFVQVLYGKFFYPASVLTGWSWFAVVPLLLVGYTLLYVQALAASPRGWRPWAGAGAVFCFLLILAIYVSTMSLTTEPALWQGMYTTAQNGTHWHFQLPRALHVLLGLGAMGAALTGLVGLTVLSDHSASAGDAGASVNREGGRSSKTAGATGLWLFLVLQVPAGLWYLQSIPAPGPEGIQLWLPAGAGLLGLLGAILMTMAVRADRPPVRRGPMEAALMVTVLPKGGLAVRPPLGWLSLVCLIGSTGLLAVQRHLVRQALAAPYLTPADWRLTPQWDVLLIFALLLLATVGLIGYLFVRFLRSAGPTGASSEGRAEAG